MEIRSDQNGAICVKDEMDNVPINSRVRVLTGKELQQLAAQHRQDRSFLPKIPQIGAIKDYEPESGVWGEGGSWLQQKILEKTLQNRREALEWPLFTQNKLLVKGIWNPKDNLVTVSHGCPFAQFFGNAHYDGQFRLSLHPEEALYLLESGQLQIQSTCHPSPGTQDDKLSTSVPWSLEDAYMALMEHPFHPLQLSQYKVYGRLVRAGYAVVRHQPEVNFTIYERLIGLDMFQSIYQKEQKGSEKENFANEDQHQECEQISDDEIEEKETAYSEVEQSLVEDLPASSSQFPSHVQNCSSDGRWFSAPKCAPASTAADDLPTQDSVDQWKTPSWEPQNLVFPNIFNHDDAAASCSSHRQIHLPAPDQRYLPFAIGGLDREDRVLDLGISWSWDGTNSDEKWIKDVKKRNSGQKVKKKHERKRKWQPWTPDEELDQGNLSQQIFSVSITDGWLQHVKKVSTNWNDYKSLLNSPPDIQSNSVMAPLWDDASPQDASHVHPLVHPNDVTTSNDIFNLLDVVKQMESETSSVVTHGNEEKEYEVVFDLYLANKSYSKTGRGAPAYRVCLSRALLQGETTTSKPPTSAELDRLLSGFRDGAPLLWAAVDHETVSFFLHFDVSIPYAPVVG